MWGSAFLKRNALLFFDDEITGRGGNPRTPEDQVGSS